MEETGDEDQMDTMMAQPTPEGKPSFRRSTQWCRSRASSRAAGLFPYTRQERCHHGFMDDFCGTPPDKASYKVKLDDSDFESALLKENSVGDGDPKKNHSLDIKKRIKHMMSIHQWTEILKPSGQRVKCQVCKRKKLVQVSFHPRQAASVRNCCEGNFSAGIELLVSYCACQLITFCLISKYF
ncbi:uncharacterized protein [Miscanthus floridulus]|uniref:uncharacterized protein n=1 Tax=Miscanthus floridulus TaxID=154761 RepID=UPI0034595007